MFLHVCSFFLLDCFFFLLSMWNGSPTWLFRTKIPRLSCVDTKKDNIPIGGPRSLYRIRLDESQNAAGKTTYIYKLRRGPCSAVCL